MVLLRGKRDIGFFNKKGDVNWFLISLIIIIISLVVIVMIIMRFNFNADIDRAACKESAVVRASITEKFNAKNLVSLSCKTKRVCVTSDFLGKGKCDSGLGSTYTTYRLTGNKESKENQIKMVLAREMADCWNMLGQGNLQIFNREITDTTWNAKVVVCSRVMFDDSVTSEIGVVQGMNSYLLSHKVPGNDISYWDYLRNANDGDTLQMLSGNPIAGSEINDVIDLSTQKAIFYLESSVSQAGGVVGALTAAGTSTLLLGSFGGAGFKAAGFLGRRTGLGSVGGNIAVISAAGIYGWREGDELYKSWVAPGLESGEVSGVFLTDYSVKGFETFQNSGKNIGFENIP